MSIERPYAPREDADETAELADAPFGELDFNRTPSRDLWDERDDEEDDEESDLDDDWDDLYDGLDEETGEY